MNDDDIDDSIAAVTYDTDDDSVVVIVGSGAGGGTLANELSRKGIDVVLIEAGPRIDENQFENDEYAMYELLTWPDKRACTGTSPIARHFPEAPTWVCKGVGGSTLHWAGLCIRFNDFEFKARTNYGDVAGAENADWPIALEDLEPYYVKAERKMGVAGTNGIPFHPPGNNFKVMSAGAKRIGYTKMDSGTHAINPSPRDGRNGCDQIGFCMQGCKSGAKWSTANAEIPAAEASGRCEVRAECMALKVELNARGRVSGVLYADRHGVHHLQKARAVCVAANAIESSRLLLNSASAMFPDGLANGSGALGRHYMRHVTGYVYAEFDRPVNMHRGNPTAGVVRDEGRIDPSRGFCGGLYFGACSLGLPFYGSFLEPGAWGRGYASWIEAYERTAGLFIQGEDMAMPTNRITLHTTEKDGYGLPIPCLHLDNHDNEIAMKNYGFRKANEIYDATGANRVFEAPPLPVSHNLGTCRMSARADDGVVNEWGQSHDVANLFVSDGSQFASSAAASPTLTIVALAIRQADRVAELMGAGAL